eukprot:1157522-Pelagomonas_calceolata.AAC.4
MPISVVVALHIAYVVFLFLSFLAQHTPKQQSCRPTFCCSPFHRPGSFSKHNNRAEARSSVGQPNAGSPWGVDAAFKGRSDEGPRPQHAPTQRP